tara:strand:- start:989 stop:1741 length:753 start_codon:yes stop_codon:yes gene_type:complete
MNKRIIARVDLNNGQLVKGKFLEGLRKLGDPTPFLRRYYNEYIDEIILLDAVASLYGRNSNFSFLKEICKEFFIPITIGGGIKTIKDIENAFESGADKVALNTAVVKDINFLKKAVSIFGSQAIIGSVVCRTHRYSWEIFIDNAKHRIKMNPFDWSRKLIDHGVGEIMFTSINNDGLMRGYNLSLLEEIDKIGNVPYIFCGGAGNINHVLQIFKNSECSAAALGSALHYNKISVLELKKELSRKGLEIRI